METSLPKLDFGVHGPHDYRAVGFLNHVGPEENPAARCRVTNSTGRRSRLHSEPERRSSPECYHRTSR